jgi:hypothetical protein
MKEKQTVFKHLFYHRSKKKEKKIGLIKINEYIKKKEKKIGLIKINEYIKKKEKKTYFFLK